MLVLNTNNSGGGAFSLSNEFLGMYPDFENSVMIIPPLMITPNIGQTILPETGGNIVADINGTKINYFSTGIVAPDYYTGLGYYTQNEQNDQSPSGIFFDSALSASTTYSIGRRIAVGKQMTGGEIVGKNIYIGTLNSWVNQGSGRNNGVPTQRVVISLLHSDGTLTDIVDRTFEFYQNGAMKSGKYLDGYGVYTGHMYVAPTSPSKIFEGSGVVAQAGDYIVETITYNWKSPGSAYMQGFLHGYKYTPNDDQRTDITQISID